MTELSRAVFLSYASQDGEAARRICEALRVGGMEIWFDQSELRGGEAWDQKIRRQINDCALFIPVISVNTQTRQEGYFRLEWRLADQRTQRMARNKAYILPVAIDATPDSGADVPESFLAVHWTRMPGGETPPSFVEQVLRLLSPDPHASPTTVLPIGPASASRLQPTSPVLSLPDKPSIAALPFSNLSGDREQDYFADGMVDEITTALTRFSSLFVIANSSTLAYRGEARNLKQIARELGVRYLLEGSVRKSGNRVRIAVKLTDAVENAPLWSERFEGTLEDVFALQDTVANAVAAQIEPAIESAEIRRANAKPTQDLDAHDLYLRALHLGRRSEKEATTEALGLLAKAIALDPSYALAMALAGLIHVRTRVNGWSKDPEESRRLGLELARRALRSCDQDPMVLAQAADAMCFLGGDTETAEKLLQRALAMCPGSAEIWMYSGVVKCFFPDQAAVGLTHFETAMRLDPRTPDRFGVLAGMAACLNALQRYDEAIPLLREAVQLRPESTAIGWTLVFSLARAGRQTEAKELASTLDPYAIASVLDAFRESNYRELWRATLAHVMRTDV
jgi:TolB-like protein